MIQIKKFIINNETEGPLYLKLADALRRAIVSGEVLPGERLPSIRRLADGIKVNTATVVAAYRILEREGWLEARAGSGVYVGLKLPARGPDAPDGPRGNPEASANIMDDGLWDLSQGRLVIPSGVLDLAAGNPAPDLFPVDDFKLLMNEVLDRDGAAAFGYQESAGWAPFRDALALYASTALGIQAGAGDIRVISGAQQGLDLAAKALLGPNDAAAVEDPTYRGAEAVFWSRGAATIPVAMDAEGMDLARLEAALLRRRTPLVYVIPRYQNPSTRCWSRERMEALLRLANRHGFYILEDDLLSDLYFGPAPAPGTLKSMDRHDRVIYIRGFSKVLMPGLRLGMLIVPPPLRRPFETAKRASDIATDGLAQRTVELYLRRGYDRQRMAFLRSHYGLVYAEAVRQAQARLEPLGASFPEPGGGLHLWIRLPSSVTATRLHHEALRRGAAVIPSGIYGNGPLNRDDHIRLSFASLKPESVAAGIRIVAEALDNLLAEPDNPTGFTARPFL